MKFAFSVFLFIGLIQIYSFGCDGDCIQCHPQLVKKGGLDNNHKILSTCNTCHKTNTENLETMGAACGQDCWDCHNVEKVMDIKNAGNIIVAHACLNSCIQCHKKLNQQENFSIDSYLELGEKHE